MLSSSGSLVVVSTDISIGIVYNILDKEELINIINKFISPNDIIIYNMSKLNLEWNDFCLNKLKYYIKSKNII